MVLGLSMLFVQDWIDHHVEANPGRAIPLAAALYSPLTAFEKWAEDSNNWRME